MLSEICLFHTWKLLTLSLSQLTVLPSFSSPATMPGEATETVPVTEQEMQQPQVETGSYILASHKRA